MPLTAEQAEKIVDVVVREYLARASSGHQRDAMYAALTASGLIEAVEALEKIKALVCGDAGPNWAPGHNTAKTRGNIADLCDAALTKILEG